MGVRIRHNERSWAIVIISEIKSMLNRMNLKIKSAGGESTLSANKKSMFPDVLLYEDESQTKVLQGWELKMPDVLITDEALIKDAARKANALGLNSFVIWNFTYGKLYVKNDEKGFGEIKVWSGTKHIKSREDVSTYREEWLPIIKDIVLTVNEFLISGKISTASIITAISDGVMTEIIQRNKKIVAENLVFEATSNMKMERRLKVWWDTYHEEYDKDENDMYSAYAKVILLNWTNRITFANTIKRYHDCAYRIKEIDNASTPMDGNVIISEIVEKGDFFNIFKKIDYNELLPEDTWIDIVDYNQFLIENKIEKINQEALQEILEKTVNTARREVKGQYATPYCLADLLCQVTINNWNDACADLCAGTGTIARAIIQNKTNRLRNAEEAFQTTWIADKYAYPLQIANIAVTNMEALNMSLNMFQEDVFAVNVGKKIKIKSPIDGTETEREIPAFGAIVSNLPFVEYNKISADEMEYIDKYRQQIKVNTGIEYPLGKADLYNYLPFKLHELLGEKGRLGIILSNSWLGTDVGKKFFNALEYYYSIHAIVVSNCKRWFHNADVIGSMIILEKKKIGAPNIKSEIRFWLINKDVHQLEQNEREILVSSIVLGEEIDNEVVTMKKYSIEMIDGIMRNGITLNAFFHDISWINEISDCLVPIERMLVVKRGERRGWNDLFYPESNSGIEEEYLKPVLKNPALLKSFMAKTDIIAFCCHKSKDELRKLGHNGALKWIEKFENLKNGIGILLPVALKKPGRFWYEMDDTAKADFVTALNPDKRLFVAKFEERTFVDQRFTRMLVKDMNVSVDLVHALLNSLYGMFAIEAVGFGRGMGVLDASSSKLKKTYMINPQLISSEDEKEIVKLFKKIKNRNVMDTEEELEDGDRERFDRKVLSAIGHEELYGLIKNALLSMQHTRHAIYT